MGIVQRVIDYYELLGVSARATEAEIRRAYRRRAIFRHRSGVLRLQDRMHEMEHAYQVLTNPEQRDRYDRQRELWQAPERKQAAEAAALIRREGRLRRAYAKRMGREATHMGRVQSARYQGFMEELEQRLAAGAPRRAFRLSLPLLVLALVAVGAVALFIASR